MDKINRALGCLRDVLIHTALELHFIGKIRMPFLELIRDTLGCMNVKYSCPIKSPHYVGIDDGDLGHFGLNNVLELCFTRDQNVFRLYE